MPLYTYRCEACGEQIDSFRRIAQRHEAMPCHCGAPMRKVIARGYAHSDVDILTDDIDNVPRHISSRKELQRVMRESDVVEKYGKGWI